MPLLSLEGLVVRYGEIEALHGVSLSIEAGEVVTLLGANGAGKSTTLMALSGLLRKAGGQVLFEGVDITRRSSHRIVAGGMVQVAEGRATLTTLTVRENLELGAFTRRDGVAAREQDIERMFALFPRLEERANGLAGNLSGGEQQMLAIARALMARPKLLLLDEPSLGLAPRIIKLIYDFIVELQNAGQTILLVEQNARLALDVSSHAYVVESGKLVLHGPSRDLKSDPTVVEAYLGRTTQDGATST